MEDVQVHRVGRDSETPITTERGRAFPYRYAYARSADTRATGDVGQDYLVFCQDDRRFAFALCDGVSQSFYGDIAACVLGDGLVDWLWRSLPSTLDSNAILPSLLSLLSSLREPATERVQAQQLPPDVPALVREVLDRKRALGSETTFVAGRLDLPGPGLPAGRVVLTWMGDSRLRLWGQEGERTDEIGGGFRSEQRWSSRNGPVGGEPHLFVAALVEGERRLYQRLVAYSDGLGVLDEHADSLSNEGIQKLIDESGMSPGSDDVSFLEVWLGPLPESVAAQPLPAPKWLEVTSQPGGLRAAWSAVPGARRYQVEARNGGRQTWESGGTACKSPPLEEGYYRLRVRALGDGGPGEWSGVWEAEVPAVVSDGAAGQSAGVPSAIASLPTGPAPAKGDRPLAEPTAVQPPPARRRRLVVAGLALTALVALFAALTLPPSGLFHGLFATPTAAGTSINAPASTPTSTVASATPSPTPPSPTPQPTGTPTPTQKATSTPNERAVQTATPTATATATSTPTGSPIPAASATPGPGATGQASVPLPSGGLGSGSFICQVTRPETGCGSGGAKGIIQRSGDQPLAGVAVAMWSERWSGEVAFTDEMGIYDLTRSSLRTGRYSLAVVDHTTCKKSDGGGRLTGWGCRWLSNVILLAIDACPAGRTVFCVKCTER